MNKIVSTFIAEGFKVGCDWTRAVFSPASEYVACGSSDGTIFVWNLGSGKIETVLKDQHHGHNVITCAWNPSGKLFISCDKSKRSVVWTDWWEAYHWSLNTITRLSFVEVDSSGRLSPRFPKRLLFSLDQTMKEFQGLWLFLSVLCSFLTKTSTKSRSGWNGIRNDVLSEKRERWR